MEGRQGGEGNGRGGVSDRQARPHILPDEWPEQRLSLASLAPRRAAWLLCAHQHSHGGAARRNVAVEHAQQGSHESNTSHGRRGAPLSSP